jgi:hypothetical protein
MNPGINMEIRVVHMESVRELIITDEEAGEQRTQNPENKDRIILSGVKGFSIMKFV